MTRLIQQLEAFPDMPTLWRSAPGISNSAGNLALHLEGNLREYIGRQLGQVPYQRQREREFIDEGLAVDDLVNRIESLLELTVRVISSLSPQQLEAAYPEIVFDTTLSTRQYLIHLHSHLNYHLGQIDYLRRFLTNGAALTLAGL
ncbi:MAG: DUF1572 domain-containing protein [Acidobacteriia bacterium]|nr:DUF1572 domain-containing protein [Terriglobia bacterium]